MRLSAIAVTTVLATVVLGGCGGSTASNEPLSPRGEQCPAGPPGDAQLDAQRSDTQRFKGLEVLSSQLLESGHPLREATLVGGESNEPVGAHVRSVAVILSGWELEKQKRDPLAVRREGEGDLRAVADRVRSAADKLSALGPAAQESELVCWSLELWKTARAYTRMAQ